MDAARVLRWEMGVIKKFQMNVIYLLTWILLFSGCICQAENDLPNIILIVADDLGYGDLGAYGCTDIETPNIDQLASEGVKFTNYYANGPECTPTRAALLSGGYQQRIGGLECAIGSGNVGRYPEAEWLSDQNELGMPGEYIVLPRLLKENGYQTAVTGKWHLGYDPKCPQGCFSCRYHCFSITGINHIGKKS